MTSRSLNAGEIWLAYVEFADHPGLGKVRPVVILDVRAKSCAVVAAKVTSKDLRTDGVAACTPIID